MYDGKKLLTAVSWLGLPPAYAAVVFFLWKSGWPLALRLVVIITLIEIAGAAIKLIYHKDRPIKMPRRNIWEMYEAGGFPSVHSARITAAMIGLSFAYHGLYIWVPAALMVFAVAYSRIYLKKHDFTDVAGGILLGAALSAILLL